MKFKEPTKLHRKSGMWGTRLLWRELSPKLAPLWIAVSCLAFLQHAGLFGGAEADQPVDGVRSTVG
jgi:hypothetical protein